MHKSSLVTLPYSRQSVKLKFGRLLKNKGFLSAISEALISVSAKRQVLSACIHFLHSRLDSGAVPSDLATHLNWVYHIIHESMRRLDVISPMYLVRSTETMIRRIWAPCYLVILVVRSVEKNAVLVIFHHCFIPYVFCYR